MSKNKNNDLLDFFIGLILLGLGLFWIFQSTSVSTNFGGSFYHIGGWSMPNGVIIIPFIIGIMMLFLCDKKIFGWIVLTLGILIILLTIIMNISIRFNRTSLFSYIMMFGFIASGGGLLLKSLFKKR